MNQPNLPPLVDDFIDDSLYGDDPKADALRELEDVLDGDFK